MTSDAQRAADLLGDASTRLTRTIDGFHADDWAAPSLLPDWSRAHVVAHLALNAEAMSRALHGFVADEYADERGDAPPTMYDSDEQRSSDIAELSTAEPSELRDRLLAGTSVLNDAMASLPPAAWDAHIERTPGGRRMATSSLPGMRVREVEVHHVDLAAGYTPADWSPEFAELLLDAMAQRLRPAEAFEVRPLDSDRTWALGDGDAERRVPVVTGPQSDLGWWLTGRPAPDTISSSHGELPRIGAW